MADPITGLTALSLVCNVVELVGFAAKILSHIREIHASGKGELEAHENMRTYARELARLNEPLKSSLAYYKDHPGLPLDDDEKALERIGSLCRAEADSLVQKLERLRVANEASWRRSAAHAVKSWLHREDIESLEKRMKTYQHAMNSISIRSVRLRQKFMAAEQTENFAEIHRQEKRMLEAIRQTPQQIISTVDIKTDLIMRTLLSQHADLITRLDILLAGPLPYASESQLPDRTVNDGWLEVDFADAVRSVSPGQHSQDVTLFDMIATNDSTGLILALQKSPGRITRDLGPDARTLLHAAAAAGNTSVVRLLVQKGAQINAQDVNGFSPLHLAAISGVATCVRALAQLGASLNAVDSANRTPRQYAQDGSEVAWILDVGPDLNAVNASAVTALWRFARDGNIDGARSLINQGANPDVSPEHAPLLIASKHGHLDVVGLLIEADAFLNPKTPGWGMNTPLHEGALEGHVDVVKRLIAAGCDLDSANEDGSTALLVAIAQQDEDMALLLIECGADVGIANTATYFPIHVASQRGLPKVVRAICERHPEFIDLGGRDAWTPLAEASFHGHIEVVDVLLEYKANADHRVDGRDRAGPLHMAANRGHVEVVRLLLMTGDADIEARDADGKTALHIAAQKNNANVVEELLGLGANPMAAEWGSAVFLPLHWVAQNGSVAITRLLCGSGKIDVNARLRCIGRTALFLAVRNRHHDCVRALLQAGADASLRDDNPKNNEFNHGPGKRYTPLMAAAINGDQVMLQILVDEGHANVNAQNKDGWTALHEVATRGNLQGIRFLLQRGADRQICSRDGMSIWEKCRARQSPNWRTVQNILKPQELVVGGKCA